ncbi:MAG: bifunctional DNA-formamidopyrimidine glycosylase/DNA-(apurinic or apyrimidinic site) lyase [Longimicrobiales bacterium]
MPELPEAETIARDLARRVTGATITGARVLKPDILTPPLTPRRLASAVRSRSIERVGRRGKNIVLELSGDVRIMVNLGMTGRVVSSKARAAADLRHIAARFPLQDGSELLYDDARRFGRIDVLKADDWQRRTGQLGVEPLSEEFTGERLYELTRTSITPMRNWLLDQRRIAGVGNIYANEALFRGGVRPTRRARDLKRREAAPLRDALRDVLSEAIEARGTTFSAYRDGEGGEGAFLPRLRVYGREGEACLKCGSPIRRVVLSNRSAFYCPRCQK